MEHFDEGKWERAIRRISEAGEPTLMLGLEEYVIAHLASRAARDQMGEVDRIEEMVASHEVDAAAALQPFLRVSRESIRGAAQSLRAVLAGDDSAEPTDELIRKARRERHHDRKLALAGQIGARIIRGERAEVTYALPDGTLKNYLVGAKTVRNVLAKNPGMSLPKTA
jgi:hypothetical protein